MKKELESEIYKLLKNGKVAEPETIYENAQAKINQYMGLAQRCKELAEEHKDDYGKLMKYTGMAQRAKEYALQYKKIMTMCVTTGETKGRKATAFFKDFKESMQHFCDHGDCFDPKKSQRTIDYTKTYRKR